MQGERRRGGVEIRVMNNGAAEKGGKWFLKDFLVWRVRDGAEKGGGHCVLFNRTAPSSSSSLPPPAPPLSKSEGFKILLHGLKRRETVFFSFYIESAHTFKQPLPT